MFPSTGFIDLGFTFRFMIHLSSCLYKVYEGKFLFRISFELKYSLLRILLRLLNPSLMIWKQEGRAIGNVSASLETVAFSVKR